MLVGCSRSQPGQSVGADSTGTLIGELHGEFVHGFNPFYGAAIYLIPANPSTADWWARLGRRRYALVGPQQDGSLPFEARTLSSPEGTFNFQRVTPGAYYAYSRVLWATTIGDSTYFDGDAWIGEARISAGETTNVILKQSRSLFTPQTKSSALELPRFGEYVYVDRLPVAFNTGGPCVP